MFATGPRASQGAIARADADARRPRGRAPALLVASFALFANAPAPAQSFDPQLVARAKQEGKVVFYTGFSGNELYRAIKKGFEDQFGIPVDMLIARPSETHERLRVEVASDRKSTRLNSSHT